MNIFTSHYKKSTESIIDRFLSSVFFEKIKKNLIIYGIKSLQSIDEIS